MDKSKAEGSDVTNLRLIEAAPKMLGVFESIVEFHESTGCPKACGRGLNGSCMEGRCIYWSAKEIVDWVYGQMDDECVFPGQCLMPGEHLSRECHTVEMMEAYERDCRGLRVIVCGGRRYRDVNAVWAALDKVHRERGISVIVQGAADGADRFAAEWGWSKGITVCSFPADWDSHGKGAGPLRNQEMVDAGADGVVAFPGGHGTSDLVARAERAGIKVWKP